MSLISGMLGNEVIFCWGFANSTLVAVDITAFEIVTSALGGYALARLKFPGNQALLLIILASLAIPIFLMFMNNWSLMMAAVTIATLPVMIFL